MRFLHSYWTLSPYLSSTKLDCCSGQSLQTNSQPSFGIGCDDQTPTWFKAALWKTRVSSAQQEKSAFTTDQAPSFVGKLPYGTMNRTSTPGALPALSEVLGSHRVLTDGYRSTPPVQGRCVVTAIQDNGPAAPGGGAPQTLTETEWNELFESIGEYGSLVVPLFVGQSRDLQGCPDLHTMQPAQTMPEPPAIEDRTPVNRYASNHSLIDRRIVDEHQRSEEESALALLSLSPALKAKEGGSSNIQMKGSAGGTAKVAQKKPKSKTKKGTRKPRHLKQGCTSKKSKDCSVIDCTTGASSRGLCKRHGGGRRCTIEGCARSDQGGGFCITHGGGKRCTIASCTNSAQARGLCKSHGGGKQCSAPGCEKNRHSSEVCRAHGVPKHCSAPECKKIRHVGGYCHEHGSLKL